MRTRKPADMMVKLTVTVVTCIALGGISGMLATRVSAQTPANTQATAVSLPPGMVDVIGLTKAGFSEDGILAKVKKAGVSYDLSVDQMIYLKNQGVSENVITALQQAGPAATPPPPVNTLSVTPPPPPSAEPSGPPSAPAPVSTSSGPPEPGTGESSAAAATAPASEPVVNFDYFHDQLAPYGTWVDVPGYGPCWHPDRAIEANPDWRPYYDMGHWSETENGLFWVSDYNWGDIPFHYGRWIRDPGYGWLWVPDYEWGPSWVFWRHAEDGASIGWAPLPYGAVFVDGGWRFRGGVFAVDYDFGLGEDYFVFVGYDHFHEPFFRNRFREYRFHVAERERHEYFRASVIRNDFHRDEHGRFVNQGIGRERLEKLTNHRVEQAKFEERNPAVRQEHSQVKKSEPGKLGGQQGIPTPQVNKVYRPSPSTTSKTAKETETKPGNSQTSKSDKKNK
jgi:hypothetical protein